MRQNVRILFVLCACLAAPAERAEGGEPPPPEAAGAPAAAGAVSFLDLTLCCGAVLTVGTALYAIVRRHARTAQSRRPAAGPSAAGPRLRERVNAIAGRLGRIIEGLRAQGEIKALKQQIEFILGATHTGLDVIDCQFNLRYVDPEWQKVYGDPTGRKCYEYFMGRDCACPGCGITKALQTKEVIVSEEVLVRENNRPIQVTTKPFQTAGGEWLVAEVNVDITERKASEDALRKSEARYRTLMESIPQKIFMKDRDSRYASINENYARDLGIRPADAVGKVDYDFFARDLADKYRADDKRVMETGQTDEFEERYVQHGRETWVQTLKTPVRDDSGQIVGVLGIFWDITERKASAEALREANRRLEELATVDELTGLWNRRQFTQMLGRELDRARRTGARLALAMVDIDQFKSINDACGHAFGDLVLRGVAKALQGGARSTDIVARYGGDEFMVLMPDTSAEEAASAAERIRKALDGRRISDGSRTMRITVSAGISALEPGGPADADGLVRAADEALYAAKHSGRDCTRTFSQAVRDRPADPRINLRAVERLRRRVLALSRRSREAFVRSIRGLVHAQEARDPFAKCHSENVARFAVGIARTMGLDPQQVSTIRRAALIHDVGKIGVPDGILWKPGALTPAERRLMQEHVVAGVRILDQMRFLEREIPIVRHHHERYDGRGYPDNISGEAIPLGSRILAAADALDAITADRPYRAARPVPETLQVFLEEAGRQFDPLVVDALIQWVCRVRQRLGGTGDVTVADLLARKPRRARVCSSVQTSLR